MSEASRDGNFVTTLLAVSSVDGVTPVTLYANPTTHRLLVDLASGMTNPMTTGGDLIYGGVAGTPTRLANGSAGQVLTSQCTTLAPIWSSAGAGDMVLASVQTNTGAKTFLNNTLLLRNPANTFSYTITAGAIAADRVLNVPVITGTDTLATLGLSQTFSGTQTFSTLVATTINGNTLTTGSSTYTGTAGQTYTFPSATTTIAGLGTIQTFTAVQTMSGLNVIQHANTGLTVRNPANTFDYTIAGGAIVAARTLNLPVITGTDTLATLGLAQTFSATQTFGTLVATTVNGNTFTTGTYTLTGTAGKTLTFTNTLTLSGTDGTTMTFPGTSKTLAANDGSNMTLTSQATGDIILAASGTTLGRLADVATGQVLVSGGVGVAPAYSANPSVTTLELGAGSTDTTLSRSSAGVLAVEGVVIPSISSTNTLTNKRITPRVGSTTSSATPTINTDDVDAYHLTAQTADITSFTTNLSGTPTDYQQLRISVTGTAARAITWGASFANGPVALPTTTVTTTRLDVLFQYDTVTSKWRCMASGSTV